MTFDLFYQYLLGWIPLEVVLDDAREFCARVHDRVEIRRERLAKKEAD